MSAPEKLTTGQKAHLATALEKIGETLINKAKEEALERARDEVSFRDYGVMFSHWPAREITRVNAEEVRKRYPPGKEEHGKLYIKTATSETVAVLIEEPPSAPADEENQT